MSKLGKQLNSPTINFKKYGNGIASMKNIRVTVA
jgi:hypothetical protein